MNSIKEWLKSRMDQVLGSPVRITDILKDGNPTGFLSQVYFASGVVTEVIISYEGKGSINSRI